METIETIQKTKWAIDPMHSEVQFKVKHLLISTVTGSFKRFEGSATTDNENFEDAEIHFSLDVNSIDTNQEMRDNHLKAADFFEAEKYPRIEFQSTSFKKVQGDEFRLVGNLTMRGVKKQITLKAEFGGEAKDRQGNLKAGFEVSGIINRKDFGVSFNSVTETGGLALGEDVKLIANIQLAKELKK